MSPGLIAAPHRGQCEAGQTTDCRRGTRWITTFRKLPTTRPRRPITTTIKLRLRAAQTYFSLPKAALHSRLEPGGQRPTGRFDPEHANVEALTFERYLPSLVASLATTFYFAPGRFREGSAYRRTARVGRSLYCTLNGKGTMIKVGPIRQSGDSGSRAGSGSSCALWVPTGFVPAGPNVRPRPSPARTHLSFGIPRIIHYLAHKPSPRVPQTCR